MVEKDVASWEKKSSGCCREWNQPSEIPLTGRVLVRGWRLKVATRGVLANNVAGETSKTILIAALVLLKLFPRQVIDEDKSPV